MYQRVRVVVLCVFVCVCVHAFMCVSVCLTICLSIYLSIYLCACLSVTAFFWPMLLILVMIGISFVRYAPDFEKHDFFVKASFKSYELQKCEILLN